MPINLRTPVVESREQRLGTVIGWQGRASDLAAESCYARGGGCGGKARRVCELQSPFTQGSVCSEQMVECQAGNVRDAVLIQHSPIGCGAGQVVFNSIYRNGLAMRVTRAIIDQFVGDYAGETIGRSVNVWALLPYQITFWRGDLTEIKRPLTGIGLKVNILFGPESAGVSEWKAIPSAQFNLVIGPWLGLQTAQHLETKYSQPFLHIPAPPIGANETGAFLRRVAAFAGLDKGRAKRKVDSFIAEEEARYYKYIEDFTDFYSEYWWGLPARFVVIGDAAYALGLTRFLVNQLGLIPGRVVVTDNPPEDYRELIREQFRGVAPDVSVEVRFEEDSYSIHQLLRQTDFGHKPPILFGTTWERDLAKELKGAVVEVGFPASYEVVLNRSYLGYRGALTLLEKIYTTAVSASA